jgi:ABC-type nitrate/sulfonate/bicarbonate transport system permease component
VTGRGRSRRLVLGLAGLLGFLALLEVAPRVGLVPERYLPPTSQILGALADELQEPSFWVALGDTLEGWAIGLALALVAGVGLGLLIGSVPALRAATASTIEFLRPIPSVALIPLAVLLFGTDLRSKLLLVVYASFWQVLIQVLYGVQDVDPVAMDTARGYRLGRWARIRHVVWPTTLPYAVTGFRLAAAVALALAITAELIIGSPGLGKEIAVAQTSGAVPAMYALVVVAGLLGVAVNALARALERRVLAWHPSARREVAA